MADIVLRLRDTSHGIRLSREAAAEIERLRAALKLIHDNADHAHRSNIRGIARDALTSKEPE